jgi:hypothetical protein
MTQRIVSALVYSPLDRIIHAYVLGAVVGTIAGIFF